MQWRGLFSHPACNASHLQSPALWESTLSSPIECGHSLSPSCTAHWIFHSTLFFLDDTAQLFRGDTSFIRCMKIKLASSISIKLFCFDISNVFFLFLQVNLCKMIPCKGQKWTVSITNGIKTSPTAPTMFGWIINTEILRSSALIVMVVYHII